MENQVASNALAFGIEATGEVANNGMIKSTFTAVSNAVSNVVKNHPVAVGAGVAALATTALCVYGHRNWGWFEKKELLKESGIKEEECIDYLRDQQEILQLKIEQLEQLEEEKEAEKKKK